MLNKQSVKEIFMVSSKTEDLDITVFHDKVNENNERRFRNTTKTEHNNGNKS